MEDPELGTLHFHTHMCDGDWAFPFPPFETAYLQLEADKSGPTDLQRKLILEFPDRLALLWPRIAEVLVRTHREIDSVEQLSERIVSRVAVLIQNDSDALELAYRFEGDPEFRLYNIVLRD